MASETRRGQMKGQVATEFFLYVAVFMFMVIAAFLIINQVQSSEIPQREATIARDTGELFASSVTLAVKNGNGFTYKYTFPRNVLGNPYTITFSPESQLMILDWEGNYGNFSQPYDIPRYDYNFPAGGCIDNSVSDAGLPIYVLHSANPACSDVLTLSNDGTTLTIINGAS